MLSKEFLKKITHKDTMFKRKNCEKCGKELKKEFEFCPYCGNPSDCDNSWGMLGKNDINNFEMPGFGLTGNIFNKMIGNAMKMIENEMQKGVKEAEMPVPRTKFQLYINGKKIPINQGNVKVIKKQKKAPLKRQSLNKEFSGENQKKFAELDKCEPETRVRRLADRIIFEISMPGVKSTEDISIRNLENSIEIKAIAKEKAYYKIISISLPVMDYYLDKDILVLELEDKN